MGCVYKVTLASGKSYIGYTTKSADARLAAHRKDAAAGSKLLFHKALRKHAVLTLDVLLEAEDEDTLTAFEVDAIAEHATRCPLGYNLTSGGEKSFAHHPDTIAILSAAMKGSQRRVGARHTEASKALMRDKKLGKKLSDETKRRMSESRKAFYAIPENRAALAEARRAAANKKGKV